MAEFYRSGSRDSERFFKDIVVTAEKRFVAAKDVFARELEVMVRANIKGGRNTGRYSTSPGWHSLSYKGNTSRRAALLAASDQTRQLRTRNGLEPAGYFHRGYAEWRSVYRGEAFRTKPVVFELTGEFMRNFRGKARKLTPNTLGLYVGFKRQSRNRESMTNRKLAEILERRSIRLGYQSPFDPADHQLRTILKRAVRVIEKQPV